MTETSIPTMSESGTDGGPSSERQPASNVHTLGRDFGRLQNHFAGIAQDVRQVADSSVAAAKETGRITVRTAKMSGTLATTAFRGRVARHPGMALGIAVGAGILIGLAAPAILALKRKSPRTS